MYLWQSTHTDLYCSFLITYYSDCLLIYVSICFLFPQAKLVSWAKLYNWHKQFWPFNMYFAPHIYALHLFLQHLVYCCHHVSGLVLHLCRLLQAKLHRCSEQIKSCWLRHLYQLSSAETMSDKFFLHTSSQSHHSTANSMFLPLDLDLNYHHYFSGSL